MKNSPEYFNNQSMLPIVGEDTIQAMLGDINETSFDDYILDTYERMSVQQPDLSAALARYSMGMGDDESEKLARAGAAGVTFRLLELQSESDDMDRSFNLDIAPGLNGRSTLPVVRQDTIDGLLDVGRAQGRSFDDLAIEAFDRMAVSQPTLLSYIARFAKGCAGTRQEEAAIVQTSVLTYLLLERQSEIDQMSSIVDVQKRE